MPKKLFEKGNPGGPGRPKGLRIRIQECADFMKKEGWEIAMSIARNEDAKNQDRISSLTLLANYGFGKPSESIDVTSDGESIKSLADFFKTSDSPKQ